MLKSDVTPTRRVALNVPDTTPTMQLVQVITAVASPAAIPLLWI
jgi:hypothetical protein